MASGTPRREHAVRIISIINQKGGCGKTTSAINLAGILARRGLRTLLVDLDPQSHCAAGLAIPEQRIDLDIGDAMLAEHDEPLDSTRLFWRASRNLDLAPSRMKLAGLEAAHGGLADKPDKERRLASVLARFEQSYDACIIDCSPSIGLLTFNALAAATDILIPVETSFFALQGATKQVNTIRSLSKRLGSAAPYWLVATLHDEASALARDLLDELRRRFGRRVAPHVIRRDLTLKEAASFGQPIIEYAAESPGASDYTALADWLAVAVGLVPSDGSVVAPEPEPEDQSPSLDPPSVEVIASLDSKLSLGRKLAGSEIESTAAPAPAPEADNVSGWDTGRVPEFASASAPASRPYSPPSQYEQPLIGTQPISQIAELTDRLQHLSHATETAIAPGEPSRAEDLAQRARAMLLKRADEQLREIAGIANSAATYTSPPPMAPTSVRGSHPTLRLIEEPKPGLETAAPARSATIRHLYGVRSTTGGTLFVQPVSVGSRVAVAGDFTGWMPIPMKRNDALRVYELCLPLPAGRRQYRLVIDGRWTADPFNDHSEPNPFGELNSVIIIEAAARTPVASA
jgi:chromosome partitioning protein